MNEQFLSSCNDSYFERGGMMGFLIIPALVLYGLFSLGIVLWVIVHAIRRGKNPWIWGFCAAFLMYNLVFWDWLPTVAVHKYYCSTEAGFWVYKSVDQWKAENPGVMETLVPKTDSHFISDQDVSSFILNERFKWELMDTQEISFLPMFKHEERVIDIKNGNTLARYADFSRGYVNSPVTGGAGWTGLKFWMVNRHCASGGGYQDNLRTFRNSVEGDKK